MIGVEIDRSRFGKIRIVKVPAGEAPLEIREKWVGVEMSCVFSEKNTNTARGVLTGVEMPQYDAYVVLQSEAIEALREKHPDAAKYWNSVGFPQGETDFFSFQQKEAEVVEPVLTREEFLGC